MIRLKLYTFVRENSGDLNVERAKDCKGVAVQIVQTTTEIVSYALHE